MFTGLLSVAFLQKVLKATQWLGISFILAGLSIVGCSDFIFKSGDSNGMNKVITGITNEQYMYYDAMLRNVFMIQYKLLMLLF